MRDQWIFKMSRILFFTEPAVEALIEQELRSDMTEEEYAAVPEGEKKERRIQIELRLWVTEAPLFAEMRERAERMYVWMIDHPGG